MEPIVTNTGQIENGLALAKRCQRRRVKPLPIGHRTPSGAFGKIEAHAGSGPMQLVLQVGGQWQRLGLVKELDSGLVGAKLLKHA
jgi:hypothetical protein